MIAQKRRASSDWTRSTTPHWAKRLGWQATFRHVAKTYRRTAELPTLQFCSVTELQNFESPLLHSPHNSVPRFSAFPTSRQFAHTPVRISRCAGVRATDSAEINICTLMRRRICAEPHKRKSVVVSPHLNTYQFLRFAAFPQQGMPAFAAKRLTVRTRDRSIGLPDKRTVGFTTKRRPSTQESRHS